MSSATDTLEIERPLGPPAIDKPSGWELYRGVFNSAKYIVAPMVDQSELPWRILSRMYGAQLAYTPMIHAMLFQTPKNQRYREEIFNLNFDEEGSLPYDRPVIAQFCANDENIFLTSAKMLAESGRIDAVDLNCGCPQGIAQRGKYGAFLMEDWPLIGRLIKTLHDNLPVPITVKIRVYDDIEKTVQYAKMVEEAGAQLLTVHGRLRSQKGTLAGLADWDKIAAVKKAVKIPVYANGNILTSHDVKACIEMTGVDGVMSAEGNLHNPALFNPLNAEEGRRYRRTLPAELLSALDHLDSKYAPIGDNEFLPATQLAKRYLLIVSHLKSETATSAVKAHLFKLFKNCFEKGKYTDIRDRLSDIGKGASEYSERLQQFHQLIDDFDAALQKDETATQLQQALDSNTELDDVPFTHSKPCLRPLSAEDMKKYEAFFETLTSFKSGKTHKRPRSASPSTVSKQPRLSPVPAPLVPSAPVMQEVKPCAAPDCVNNSSQRCIRGACSTCCDKLGEEECQAHMDRAQKKKDKAAKKRELNAAKKAIRQKSRQKKQPQKDTEEVKAD